jgi:hypothetical protein
MAFVIQSPKSRVSIDAIDDPIFEVPDRLEHDSPQFARLAEHFGTSFAFEGAELRALAGEFFHLLDKFRAFKETQLTSLGIVTAEDPVVQATVFDQIVRRNPVHAKLEALLACAKEAIDAGSELRCEEK